MNSKLFSLGIDPLFLIIVIGAFAVVSFVVCVIVLVKVTKLWHRYDVFMRGRDASNLEELLNQTVGEMVKLIESHEELEKEFEKLKTEEKTAFKKVAIRKYNAFKDSTGKLSFSVVLLDSENDGFILTCMHANGPSYTYVKEIIHGESYVSLSAEETEALKEAMIYD